MKSKGIQTSFSSNIELEKEIILLKEKLSNSRYYGSDLNIFIDKECSRQMTCVNIDCLMIKLSKKRIRIIESKHSFEPMKKGQFDALNIISNVLSQNTPNFNNWKREVYVITGEEPYQTVHVKDVSTNKEYKIHSKNDFIKWLEFESEIEDVSEEFIK